MKAAKQFDRFAWLVLLYNLPVILWGAYVRISFSGDGCGADWPFCAGHAVPANMARPMVIEYTHRMMTTLDLVLMAGLVVWAFRLYPRAHAVRRYASWSAFFLFVEALLGAGLVLFRKVAHDQSAGRAVYLSAHLTNTMLLLGALTATAWLAADAERRVRWRRMSPMLVTICFVTVLVSVTGALTALGDTLFPAASLAAGMREDFAAGSHILLKLRLFHPLTAIAGAGLLVYAGVRAHTEAGTRMVIATVLQVVLGAANLTLLAPVWMQLVHLLTADAVWITVVLFALEQTMQAEPAEKRAAAVSTRTVAV